MGLLGRKVIAQFSDASLKLLQGRVNVQEIPTGLNAEPFRAKDFVRRLFRRVCQLRHVHFADEGICPHDRLMRLQGNPRETSNETTGGINLVHPDLGLTIQRGRASLHNSGKLLKSRVAGPLTDPVHGTVYLRCPLLESRQGIRHGQPEIIVAVDAKRGFLEALQFLLQPLEQPDHIARQRNAHRIRQVDGRGAGLDGSPAQLNDFHRISPKRVNERKLHIGGQLFGHRNG